MIDVPNNSKVERLSTLLSSMNRNLSVCFLKACMVKVYLIVLEFTQCESNLAIENGKHNIISRIFSLVECDTVEKRRETIAKIKCKAIKGTCKLHHLAPSKSNNSILVQDFMCCCEKC